MIYQDEFIKYSKVISKLIAERSMSHLQAVEVETRLLEIEMILTDKDWREKIDRLLRERIGEK